MKTTQLFPWELPEYPVPTLPLKEPASPDRTELIADAAAALYRLDAAERRSLATAVLR
jgi:hypothetical protein